jgi:hypothetical protein
LGPHVQILAIEVYTFYCPLYFGRDPTIIKTQDFFFSFWSFCFSFLVAEL